MSALRKVIAVVILATFAGFMVEVQAAGPFRPVAWWRAPLTGGLIAGIGMLVGWANRELTHEPA